MSDIFICYSKTDRAIATRLGQRLREEGWSVFMDDQTYVGERWNKQIEKELHAARAVVVLWSAQSRDSDFVLEEAEYGRRKEILFPAFIERVQFPYGFGRIQTADLIGWVGDDGHPGLAELLEPLKVHLKGREATPNAGATAAAHDTFISYASEDVKRANAIVAALECRGRKCWIAQRDIPAGTSSYARAITRAIKASRLMIVIVSAHSSSSDDVLNEITLAKNNKVPRLPFRIDDAALDDGFEYFFSQSQWLDAADMTEGEALQALVADVAKHFG